MARPAAAGFRGLRVFGIDLPPSEVRLSADFISGGLRLTWSSTATGFALESSADPTATSWDPVPGAPELNGDEFELTIPTRRPGALFPVAETVRRSNA
jgi:hypothetical protein